MIKLKSLLTENTLKNVTQINAILIWLDKDGTVYDTNDTQHGLYVADNNSLFGVNNALVKQVFKNANTDKSFDFDEASAAMCEQAFAKGWMRVVKVPWNNKIFVEGNEPTKAQKQVLEDKSKSIIWQRWVSSKFGPIRPITLFYPESETGNELSEETGFNEKYFFCGDCRTILDSGQLFSDATEMAQAIENSTPLTKLEFIDKIMENSIPKQYKLFRVHLSRNPDDFEFGEGSRFIFAYDTISDIHYFFTL